MLALLTASCLASASCAQERTILFVEVAGPETLAPVQFDVTVTAGPDTRKLMVPKAPVSNGGSITLPASFTLTLDSSRTGPLTISIDALDAAQSPIGHGTTMMQHIVIDGQTIIEVMLSDELPPQGTDTGADAVADGRGLDGGAD